jgi:hypothetical protein
MSTSLEYSKTGLKLVGSTSTKPAPRPQQIYPIPPIPVAVAILLDLALETVAETGRKGIRITSRGSALPGESATSWTLLHACYQGTAPANLAWEEIPVTGAKLNLLLDLPLPSATHRFRLRSVLAGQTTLYPEATIATPADTTVGDLAALMAIAANAAADGKIIDSEKVSLRRWLEEHRQRWMSAYNAAVASGMSEGTGTLPDWKNGIWRPAYEHFANILYNTLGSYDSYGCVSLGTPKTGTATFYPTAIEVGEAIAAGDLLATSRLAWGIMQGAMANAVHAVQKETAAIPASATSLGTVKPGAGLTVAPDGTLNLVGGGSSTWSGLGGVPTDSAPLMTLLNAKLGTGAQAYDSARLGGQLPSYYQAALGFTPINKAGDTGIGNLSMGALTATNAVVSVGDAGAWFDARSQRTSNNIGGMRFFDSTGTQKALIAADVAGTLALYAGMPGVTAPRLTIDANTGVAVFAAPAQVSATPLGTGAMLTLRDTSATGTGTYMGGLFLNSSPGHDFLVGKRSVNGDARFVVHCQSGPWDLLEINGATKNATFGGWIYTGAIELGHWNEINLTTGEDLYLGYRNTGHIFIGAQKIDFNTANGAAAFAGAVGAARFASSTPSATGTSEHQANNHNGSDVFAWGTTGASYSGTLASIVGGSTQFIYIPGNGTLHVTGVTDGAATLWMHGNLLAGGTVRTRQGGVDGTYRDAIVISSEAVGVGSAETHAITSTISSAAQWSGLHFDISNGGGSSARTTALALTRASAVFNAEIYAAGSYPVTRAKYSTDAAYLSTPNNFTGDPYQINNHPGLLISEMQTSSTNSPSGGSYAGTLLHFADAGGQDVRTLFCVDSSGNDFKFNQSWGNGAWRGWKTVYHSGNIDTSSAGLAAFSALMRAPAVVDYLSQRPTPGTSSTGLNPIGSYVFVRLEPANPYGSNPAVPGGLYKNVGGTWTLAGQDELVAFRITAASIAAGAIGAQAVQTGLLTALLARGDRFGTTLFAADGYGVSNLPNGYNPANVTAGVLMRDDGNAKILCGPGGLQIERARLKESNLIFNRLANGSFWRDITPWAKSNSGGATINYTAASYDPYSGSIDASAVKGFAAYQTTYLSEIAYIEQAVNMPAPLLGVPPVVNMLYKISRDSTYFEVNPESSTIFLTSINLNDGVTRSVTLSYPSFSGNWTPISNVDVSAAFPVAGPYIVRIGISFACNATNVDGDSHSLIYAGSIDRVELIA